MMQTDMNIESSDKAIGLLSRLPKVRGRLIENAPLGKMTWFRVGGAAEILFKPADEKDLIDFLKNCPADIPIMILGVASNLIIRDGGIKGVVIKLGKGFTDINVHKDTITAGVAALDLNIALTAARVGLAGLEFFSGIPGSIGGALRMNAGAYGTETKDVLISATAVDRQGEVHHLTPEQMGMSYRHNDTPKDYIFTSASFKATGSETTEVLEQRIADIKQKREDSQPIREKTSGSTFANPDGHKAWQLIDQAGCRGLMVGGAQISEKHCNFMINTGDATAADLENLGEEVRRRVKENSGVELRWEIKRIGEAL